MFWPIQTIDSRSRTLRSTASISKSTSTRTAFTADSVRGGRFGDAIFVVGADEGRDFPGWKEPDEVLRWVRLAVGTRSGYPPPDLERYGDRILSFELDSPEVSSSEPA